MADHLPKPLYRYGNNAMIIPVPKTSKKKERHIQPMPMAFSGWRRKKETPITTGVILFYWISVTSPTDYS
jgi:hypothetical protein